MANNYKSFAFYSGAITTASADVLIGTIDIGNYDKFSLFYANLSATSVLVLTVQVATDPDTTSGNWVTLSTATLEQPDALGTASTVVTSVVDNSWKYLRVLGNATATAVVNSLRVNVSGFERF